MNKFQKMLIGATVIGMVGFAFAILTLKGLPEAFDWETEDYE